MYKNRVAYSSFEKESCMENLNRIPSEIVDNVEKVIIGKRHVIETAVIALLCRGHLLIEDVPGVGKTSLASAIARSINCSFKRIQFTPDVLPSDITGYFMFNRKTGDFEYRPGAIMSNMILADEINRTTPKTQASLLEVMEEGQVTVDGTTYKVPQPFMVLATQNPIEYTGTFPLPEAQIDRFFMKISIGYPSPSQESSILNRYMTNNPFETLSPVAEAKDIIEIQEHIKTIHVDQSINDYIIEITGATRAHQEVRLGSSPRGSLALLSASQAHAFYSGRDFVIPDDVKKMAVPVLAHRLILKQEARIKRISPEDVIQSVIAKANVPVVKENVKN